MLFDRLFDLALLLVLLGFLWIGWTSSQNGRYVYHSKTEQAEGYVIDTRTGTVFELDTGHGAFYEMRPQTGAMVPHQIWLPPTKQTVPKPH
ncbi:MAG TPA: hypothetical protein VME43_26440 [Bryobacteraceae bacterium]|nr:hypothetical protein [Bryobacteraceae bacterium]